MQIGQRGVVDTSDGTLKGRALNSSHTQFYMPSDIAVDRVNDEVYVADGYGNSHIAVFDRSGKFIRQWAPGDKRRGRGGCGWCVHAGCALCGHRQHQQGDRIQVFDKMGSFKNNIWIKRGNGLPDNWGTTWWIGFSPDREQKYMYLDDGGDEQVKILDHASGEVPSSFGRPGHQIGAVHLPMATPWRSIPKATFYGAETDWGRRVQRFKPMK